MSRLSVKSRESSARSLIRRRKKVERSKPSKPIDFCCTAEDIDPLTRYNQRRPPYTSSLTAITAVQECPAIKFSTKFVDHLETPFKKPTTSKAKDVHFDRMDYAMENLAISSVTGPIQWYIEEELALAKDILWEERLLKHNEETQKNIRIGRKNVQAELKQMTSAAGPRWYQDFSINQMRNLIILEDVIHEDYKQMVTGRTQKILIALGVMSTFFKIDPKIIRRMQRSCDFKAIDFLREVYRLLTGNYFEDEGYKISYDCNERIILSGIAFLTLPETIVELHKRLPPITLPKLPSKPLPMKIPPIQKMSSPYKEKLFTCPDWSTYLNRLQRWRNLCKMIPIPKVILPTEKDLKHTYKEKLRSIMLNDRISKNDHSRSFRITKNGPKKEKGSSKRGERLAKGEGHSKSHSPGKTQKVDEFDIPRLPDENQVFDFTLSGLSEKKAGPVKYKICGVLNPPRENKKSWLGEKDAHFVITGVSDDPPQCPVSYEMTGVANVTPTNSNERFFTVLKLGDGPKKIYPHGRQNLSKNWQEWLLNADEQFKEVEKEANKILKSVEATMRLVFPGPTCDSCCSCRQTRKIDIIRKQTKAPYMVIDTLTEDEKNQKYIVGSMALHSPAPTPHESTVNLLEIIASEDKIITNVVINGVTTENGEKKYYITGMKDETIRIPSRRVEPPPPLPPKNVPPCSCAIQQMFNAGVTPRLSTDNIPWTKDEGHCFGKKYRPEAAPAYSCKASPGDKSCRLNPFLKEVARLERKKREKKKSKEDYYLKGKKIMYSIADFKPCGDEHGMSVCGGPWGTQHVMSPAELAEQERQRKEILRGPPCGTRPGRAVCGGPFGERIPEPVKPRVRGEDDEDDEEDEEDEEVTQEVVQPAPIVKPKVLQRGKLCHASPESIAAAKQMVKKKVTKFIPDPDYHGYDDPWNVFRTAPSVKETETEYEKTLKLSSPKPRSDPPKSIREIMKKRASSKGSESIRSFAKSGTSVRSDNKRGVLSFKPTSDKLKKETKGKVIKSTSGKFEKKVDASSTQRKTNRKRTSSSSPKRKEANPFSEKSATRVKNIIEDKNQETQKKMNSSSPKRKEVNPSSEKSDSRKGKAMLERNHNIDLKDTQSDMQSREKKKSASKMTDVFSRNNNGRKRKKRNNNNEKRNEARKLTRKLKSITNDFDSKIKTSINNVGISRTERKAKKKVKKEKETTRDSVTYKIKSKRSRGSYQINSKHKTIRKDSIKQRRFSKVADGKKSDRKKSKISLKDVSSLLMPEEQKKQEMERLKTMMTSSDAYPHHVEPVTLPQDPPGMCKHEYDTADTQSKEKTISEEITSSMQVSKKGPCGWRTKSEQELPVKKTLAYITDPDPPLETISVRPGGKACICRENRNKKKILMYQIGGSVGKKKAEPTKLGRISVRKKEEEEDRSETRVIDGVIYYTPPPSRRRSDEYVPEYDLYESPYEMCADRRKDSFLNMLEKYTAPRDVMSKIRKTVESCDCSGYLDTYGVVGEHAEINEAKRLLEERERLMESKEPKQRWELALKDKGLMDYYAGCKHSSPCWSTCKKLNKYACPLKPRRLKQKKPVCECKYERKIVEKKEEKIKWRERQKKLRSFKKEPFVNVTDTSRPMEADTKLIISGVKRIPRQDEYIDDVQYCISGVAENYTMGPATQVVGGLNMSTPFHTPEPSKEKIPCVCLHSHWSQSKIPPGPLPRKDEALIKERERRQKYLEEAAQLIYGPHDESEESQKWYRSCKAKCEDHEKVHASKRKKDTKVEEKHGNSIVRNTPQKSFHEQKGVSHSKKVAKRKRSVDDGSPSKQGTVSVERKMSKEVGKEMQKTDLVPVKKVSIKQDQEDPEEDVEIVDSETTLENIVKSELRKMAEEGFLFAKLPKCHRMPQLQNWIMYRKGFVMTDEERDKFMRLTLMTWEMANVARLPQIVTPSLGMSKKQIRELTFDTAKKMKKKIASKNAVFYSQLRKSRVLYGRSMWGTMEFRRYPSISFKKAYFAYMAAKEADGHVFKPWMTNEVREQE